MLACGVGKARSDPRQTVSTMGRGGLFASLYQASVEKSNTGTTAHVTVVPEGAFKERSCSRDVRRALRTVIEWAGAARRLKAAGLQQNQKSLDGAHWEAKPGRSTKAVRDRARVSGGDSFVG
jgi:hypothetical protein